MANLSCIIDSTGITAPNYNDVLTNLKDSYYSIFGSDAYLGNDSQDGQLLAIFAAAINDCNASTINTYNSFSPAYAQGAGLSSNVKINGIKRLVPTNSTAIVEVIGQAGTIINNGVVSDINSRSWNLPTQIIIPISGTITVLATAIDQGAITAPVGSISGIGTPTRGWQSVNNTSDAVPGNPVETDAQLRQRQTVSTSYPAVAVVNSISAAVANTTGVVQSVVYENSTATTDSNGIPGHSISVVVYGGDPINVATAIANKKTPGTGTYGTTSEVVQIGSTSMTIYFYEATTRGTTATINIIAKTGYTSTIGDQIKADLAAYITSLSIGQPIEFSQALSYCVGPTYKLESIKFTVNSTDYTNVDVSNVFNALFVLPLTGITLVVT